MTPARAKEVLEGMRLSVFTATELLKLDEHYNELLSVTAKSEASLHSIFNADQLQAIALWMQDPEGVTNAEV